MSAGVIVLGAVIVLGLLGLGAVSVMYLIWRLFVSGVEMSDEDRAKLDEFISEKTKIKP